VTLQELKVALSNLDEVTLLELLDLHADEIVARFDDIIEERYDELKFKVDEPDLTVREEERYQPLTGELSWKNTPYQEASDFFDENE